MVVGNVDRNGQMELSAVRDKTVVDSAGHATTYMVVYLWEMPLASSGKYEWPMFSHDAARTGRLSSGGDPIPPTACDVDKNGTTDVRDIQQEANQAIGVLPCTADVNRDGACNVIDVQRVVNAALGGQCVSQ